MPGRGIERARWVESWCEVELLAKLNCHGRKVVIFVAYQYRFRMAELEIQQSILQALGRMSLGQQIKLLEFINSISGPAKPEKTQNILQFAGIFDATDTAEFEAALQDCEQIDHNEW